MSYASLIAAPIDNTTGIPAGYLTWRYVIRVAKAPSNKVLGTMILGTDVLADLTWVDVTGNAQGLKGERGATAGVRPGAGEFSFWLDNTSAIYDPYLSIYHGPGILVQVLFGTAADTRPVATGLATKWDESSQGHNAVRTIDVEVLETISVLGESNRAAQAPAGAGESIGPRAARIINNAGWAFGGTVTTDAPHFSWGLQATTLAQTSWADLLLTVDSLAVQAVSAKNGALAVTERDRGQLAAGLRTIGPNTPAAGGTDIAYVDDSIVTANDDDTLLGHIDLARVGGTAVGYNQSGIQGRYQDRSTQRYDLITQDPGANADLARYAADAFGRGKQPYRVEAVDLQAIGGDVTASTAKVWEFFTLMEIGTRIAIAKPDSDTHGILFSGLLVCGYSFAISTLATGGGVALSATVRTAVQASSTWARY